MTRVETPAADIVAARITLTADSIEAACAQLDTGILPTQELTARIRAELKTLRTCNTADATALLSLALTTGARAKVRDEH